MSVAPHEPATSVPEGIATRAQRWAPDRRSRSHRHERATVGTRLRCAMSLAPHEPSTGAPELIATSAQRRAPVLAAETSR